MMRGILLILFLLPASYAQTALLDEWLVVEERMESVACCSAYTGAADKNLAAQNVRLVFSPSEVVHVIKREGNKFLVQGYASDVSAWLDKPKLVATTSFQPLSEWSGQSHFEISSVDSGQVYKIAKNATFTASFDDNHEPRKWTGRLYKYKQLIWAKPNGDRTGFSAWSVFQLKEDGTICI